MFLPFYMYSTHGKKKMLKNVAKYIVISKVLVYNYYIKKAVTFF